ncbi:MAG: 6-phosphofructokinase [Oscillospiraceae bacterium]|jgi:6-phosphofructokinase 1|nr:6-phosphofructokinase [Oscillospiraceae bacterium]
MKKIGILTSGGDCPGLNATIRGVAKSCYEIMDNAEIIGIQNGYYGLINNIAREMKPSDFSGILTLGGTILGSKRQPFKMLSMDEEKIKAMKDTYKKLKLDCLLTLGGCGTHKTANLLSTEGLNVIGLPKTIDNDIFGTDYTFGYYTAIDIATECIDRLHTTATSHSRVMVCEIMGNKVGWLTLSAGIAGGADIILIPEIPYDIDKLISAVTKRAENGKSFSIIAVAEGAYDVNEAKMKKKERAKKREEEHIITATNRIVAQIQNATGMDTRACVPGHILRGGSPNAFDRILATKLGAKAAELIKEENFGKTVALVNNKITTNKLSDIAGITKFIEEDNQLLLTAKDIGIHFGV